ncbi:hypothetical protein B0H13DRAFT_2667137 [Mycena leptocephala]|nr:hypothetical protein B0H13DRAFT_2667137 [Mycena leptocephala]
MPSDWPLERDPGIYENGVPVCVAIFSYVDDPSGANTVNAVISIARATMPASVRVKYLAVTTVVQKLGVYVGGAAQTFGGNFESDGRPSGTLDIKSVRSIDFMRATNGLTYHGAPQSTLVATALADASDLIISASVHGACASSSPSATN